MVGESYLKITPEDVLSEVAEALPDEVLGNIVIIGSLAAAYWLLDSGGVRTKDVDCVLSPRLTAVEKGRMIMENLLKAKWVQKSTGEFGKPGDKDTPEEELPAVRLYPPGEKGWFLEILTEPESGQRETRNWTRLPLGTGQHFGIPSLRFLSLAVFDARETEFGFRIARPEMMVLSNLLEHPELKPDLIHGTDIKRSNKDLGRALAIAYLTQDEKLKMWPEIWKCGLRECFPEKWEKLALRTGNGLSEMLGSPEDMQQAFETSANGILAGNRISVDHLRAVGRRLIGEVIEPLVEKQ